MNRESYTIGENCGAQRRLGAAHSVLFGQRTASPMAQTSNGYWVYSEADLARLDLTRALRDAGVSLEAIRKILSRRLTLDAS
jgi:MerR HTH family regulatory protein